MDVTSLLSNNSATPSLEEPSLEANNPQARPSETSRLSERPTNRSTPELETDLLDYSEAMTQDTDLVLPQRSDFTSLSSSLPPINVTGTRRPAEGAQRSELGVSPALINSRATSLALETMSNRSTPVPRPVERQNFAIPTNTATGFQIQSPTPRQPNQTLIPAMDQSQAPDGQEDIIVDNEQLETIINLFNDQWLMFVQAREHQNVPMMRFALQQAIGSQEVIRNLAGGEEMLRICENWIAQEELADLERAERINPTPQVQRLAITQRAHSHTVSPSPAPLPLARQTSEITYLGRGQQPAQDQPSTQRPQTALSQHSARSNQLPPPPPPSTQPPPASAYYNQRPQRQAQHHPYHRQGGPQHQQQYPQQLAQNYDQHHQVQVAPTHERQQGQFHPPPTRRLERIREELEDSPKSDGKIARSGRLSDEGGESSGKSFPLSWEGKRKESSPTTRLPTTRTTPLDSPHSFNLDDLSIQNSRLYSQYSVRILSKKFQFIYEKFHFQANKR
ncbi:hypothetical protein PGT21_005249 [Puccinia graminis f. sp. tritici]|uniref:Uncharacterized protein n=1 Tax=Puccinia graminis f. sp. tritici TaxID=56615 RepID=A0A5B0NTF8_PUCGR|nr:hypothetical protein PGT21_005249 [Puccinia graminis f. sp. tritici]